MGKCQISAFGASYDYPPEGLRAAVGDDGYDYLLSLHMTVFGTPEGGRKGDLDITDNISGVQHNELDGITVYDHHGAGSHSGLDQGVAVTSAVATTVAVAAANAGTVAASDAGTIAASAAGTVVAADAGATYTAAEQTLINEIKSDYNAAVTLINELRTDYGTMVTVVNETKADYNTAVTLINELKTDMTTMATEVDAVVTQVNALLTSLRDAALILT